MKLVTINDCTGVIKEDWSGDHVILSKEELFDLLQLIKEMNDTINKLNPHEADIPNNTIELLNRLSY